MFPFEIVPQRDVNVVDTVSLHLHANVGVGADAGINAILFIEFSIVFAAHKGDGGTPDVALLIELRARQHMDDRADFVVITVWTLANGFELAFHEIQTLGSDFFVDARIVFVGQHVFIFRTAAQKMTLGGFAHMMIFAMQGKVVPAWAADDDPITVHDWVQAEAIDGVTEHELQVFVGIKA